MQKFFNSISFTVNGAIISTLMTLLYIKRSMQPDADTFQFVITGIWAFMASTWISACVVRVVRSRRRKPTS